MDSTVYELHNSPVYADVLRLLGIAALLAALGVAGLAVFSGAPRWKKGDRRTDWDMLFESWRDSFAVTMLYVAYDLTGSFEQYAGLSTMGAGGGGLVASLVAQYLRLAFIVAIGVIALRRFLELGRWLKLRREAAAARENGDT